jgi:NAD(P)-dependent dehydrogenase (short-subunit alcohol dehydrogenase family)
MGVMVRSAAVGDERSGSGSDHVDSGEADGVVAGPSSPTSTPEPSPDSGPAGRLAGRRVLLTGASSGIGASAAVLLAAEGATVGLVARRADRLDEVLAACRAHAPDSRRWAADLSDLAVATRVADEAWEAFGGLDAVVNNAAIPKRRKAADLTIDEVAAVLQTNFLSPTQITLHLLPRLVAAGSGVIVNVSSLAGRVGVPGEPAYSASKFALCGWTESLYIELAGTGVEARLVLPGAIETEIWDLPDNDPPVYDGPKEPASSVAAAIVDAVATGLEGGGPFETYVPDLKPIVELKTSDADSYLQGAVAFRDGAAIPESSSMSSSSPSS